MSLASGPLSGPWPARATWLLLPVLVGPALGSALGERSTSVSITAAVMGWLIWTGVVVATLVPRTLSLTALRIAAPLVPIAAVWAATSDEAGALDVLAVSWSLVVALAAFSPLTGDAFVDGSSYGDERRLPLRVPGPLLLGPLPVTWALGVAGPVAGPLLLAAEQWVLGAAVLLVGALPARLAVRALHGLARRWVVFVPAGMVLHDPAGLADPVMFRRADIAGLGPAPADVADDALDLTQGSFGLALQLEATEASEVAPRITKPTAEVEVVETRHLLFTPTRPGAVLAEAERRRIAVG